MLTNKYLEKWIILFMATALCISMSITWIVMQRDSRVKGVDKEYKNLLFTDGRLASIDIEIEDSDWDDLIQNALKKKYHACNVTINGETFKNAGIRTKGSSSLSGVKEMNTSDRYSFLIKFDKYVDGQTYHGLDKLALNNMIADTTQMKDAVTYDMCHYLKLQAPLYTYANLSVRGKYFGCYLALEPIDKSFCERNFGADLGSLYIPSDFGEDGGNLNYIGNNIDSYTGIFETVRFGGDKKSRERVVRALKSVHDGKDIEKYVDVDPLLKYMAVQTVAVNLDSPAGKAMNNVFLYEKGGKIWLIPWDYNLAYGAFEEEDEDEFETNDEEWENIDWSEFDEENWYGLENMDEDEFDEEEGFQEPFDYKTATRQYINFPIDTPYTAKLSKRQFFIKLLENEQYKNTYHQYLSALANQYINGGKLEKTILGIHRQIDPIVCTEKNSFFSKEEYLAAVTEFKKLLKYKAESINGQLNGTIPSTTDGQAADSSTLIIPDDIKLEALGGGL